MPSAHDLLRDLPSVDRLLAHSRIARLLGGFGRDYVRRCCRETLDDLRNEITQDARPALDEESILAKVEQRVVGDSVCQLRQVVNATGTVLHTNLGRALLPQAAVDAIRSAAAHHTNLEYDLTRGERGRRETAVEQLLVELTGAEAATAVNNNAAAVLVVLNTLAAGKEVIVSRGELIEIGGAFRIPEIMAKSGAILREVGTTNRTHERDYEEAIGPETGLILKVHTSNYRIVGFSTAVSLDVLVALGRRRGVPVMEDLGSGALVDLASFGLPKEPLVAERVAAGADVVTFSGDKLLGGPQAGLIVGRTAWLREIGRNPLHRAVRCDKLAIAGLEATLLLYRQSARLAEDIPTLKALSRPVAELDAIGRQILPALQRMLGEEFLVSLVDSAAQIGSGALPTDEIPSKAIAIEGKRSSAEQIGALFRTARPPIIGRIKDGRFLLDLRSAGSPADLVPRWGAQPMSHPESERTGDRP